MNTLHSNKRVSPTDLSEMSMSAIGLMWTMAGGKDRGEKSFIKREKGEREREALLFLTVRVASRELLMGPPLIVHVYCTGRAIETLGGKTKELCTFVPVSSTTV